MSHFVIGDGMEGGPMRTIIAMVVLVLAATVANAAPVYLSCEGKTTIYVQDPSDHVIQERAHGVQDLRRLAVDLSTKTVTLEGGNPTPIVRMNEQWIDFEPKDPSLGQGVLSGRLNRIMGTVYFKFVTSFTGGKAYFEFDGTCKLPEKLF
jgi:hypothetical protein